MGRSSHGAQLSPPRRPTICGTRGRSRCGRGRARGQNSRLRGGRGPQAACQLCAQRVVRRKGARLPAAMSTAENACSPRCRSACEKERERDKKCKATHNRRTREGRHSGRQQSREDGAMPDPAGAQGREPTPGANRLRGRRPALTCVSRYARRWMIERPATSMPDPVTRKLDAPKSEITRARSEWYCARETARFIGARARNGAVQGVRGRGKARFTMRSMAV